MKLFLCLFALVLAFDSYAGFGGSRGGFSGGRSFGGFSRSYSAPRSSFGGFRSTPSAPIVRSAPSYSRPSYTTPHTTIVNGGGTGSGFVNGMLMGSILSRPHTTVVAPGAAAPVVTEGGYVAPAPAVVVEQPGVLYRIARFLLGFIVVGALLAFIAAVVLGLYGAVTERRYY